MQKTAEELGEVSLRQEIMRESMSGNGRTVIGFGPRPAGLVDTQDVWILQLDFCSS